MATLRQICEAIKALSNYNSDVVVTEADNDEYDVSGITTDDLKALVTAYEAATEWVDVADRLPEVGTIYFARGHDGCIDAGTVSEGMYDSGYWQGLYVAWMPIPPYKEQDRPA